MKYLIPVFVILTLAACKKESHSVTYEVACEACAVSYYNDEGVWIQREAVVGSFAYDFTWEEGTEHSPVATPGMRVSAQNDAGVTADLSCVLTFDGTVIKDTTGTGEDAVVWADLEELPE
jgi:hypothetical protein